MNSQRTTTTNIQAAAGTVPSEQTSQEPEQTNTFSISYGVELPTSENGGCTQTCQMSYKAIKSTITKSKYILNTLYKHPQWKRYRPELRKLFWMQVFVCLITVCIDVGISFPMQWAFTALDQTRNQGIKNDSSNDDTAGVSFTTAIIIYSIISIISSPMHGIEYNGEMLLYLKFREATTKCLLHDFHNNSAFYYLATSSDETVGNPGQRYELDIDWWTYSIVLLLFHCIRQIITITGIVIVLIHLQVNIVLYAFIGAVFVTLGCLAFFGSAITQLQTIINEKKAAFRAGMVRTSDNAEAISMYKAEKFEEKWSFQRFMGVVNHRRLFFKYMAILDAVIDATKTVGLMLPVFLLSNDFFSGKITLGMVTQSAYGFQTLLISLTTIVGQMDKVGSIQATAIRLSELMDAIDRVVTVMTKPPAIERECLSSRSNMYTSSAPTPRANMTVVVAKNPQNIDNTDQMTGIKFSKISSSAAIKDVDTFLKVSNLSVVVPKSETLLLSNISFSVKKSESLLIVGPSGAGKSSLIRVLSKLWKFGEGDVQMLSNNTMFLPQRPYLPILPPSQNTLENQLLFPQYHNNKNDGKQYQQHIGDEEMQTLLTSLNLSYILEYNTTDDDSNDDGSKDWSKLLSLGEQQRLAIGRVLLKQPKLVFLDESTSALDTQNQSQMYQLLQDYGITFVSVGHRPNLHAFHENVLVVLGDGNWKYMSSQEYDEKYIQTNAGFNDELEM